MVSPLTDLASETLAKSLDAIGLRHRVIANNIANGETPGFKRSDVSFHDLIKQALDSGEDSAPERIDQLQFSVEKDSVSPVGPNGNNVSVDREMAELTKNSIEYETSVRLLNMKSSMLTTAITEGKR